MMIDDIIRLCIYLISIIYVFRYATWKIDFTLVYSINRRCTRNVSVSQETTSTWDSWLIAVKIFNGRQLRKGFAAIAVGSFRWRVSAQEVHLSRGFLIRHPVNLFNASRRFAIGIRKSSMRYRQKRWQKERRCCSGPSFFFPRRVSRIFRDSLYRTVINDN